MPRNASGTYSLPSGNPVSSGTLIDANWANNTLNDLANEVTDSLSRSAEGGMLAPLRLTDGVQATPSLAFTNEPSTGLYRAGTNEAWFVTGGNQVAKFTSTGMEGRFAAGAAATPSLAAYNDVNTGLWFPAADTIAASVGGVEGWRLTSAGNLGIGTTSPSNKLEVVGTAAFTGIGFNANAINTTSTASRFIRLTSTGGDFYVGTESSTGGGVFPGSTAYAAVLYNASATPMQFWTGGTLRATLDSSGNLGIGTASPAHRLDVAYDANAVSSARVVNSNTGSSATATLRLDTQGATWTINNGRNGGYLSFSDGGGERARFDNAGNLGIGTASPAQRLHVNGDIQQENANYLRGKLAAGTATRLFGLNAANSLYVGGIDAAQSETLFVRGGTEQMRLDSSGNLGIGTASPSFRLDVTGAANSVQARFGNVAGRGLTIGTALVGGTNDAGVVFDAPITGDGTLIFQTVSTERMRITATGNIVAGASAALATTATNGFLYVPTCAGTPTGTPTAITGMAPIVVNTTNNKLYFYSGGAWRDAGP